MPFSSLTGNERIKTLLKRAVFEGRIAQGLILAGPVGVGKHAFALALAEAVNCERPIQGDSCGVCLPCRKIAAGEHPDVRTEGRKAAKSRQRSPVEPASDGLDEAKKSQFIKIDQMRGLSSEAQFRPYEGKRRVLIIDEADRLNEAASNSILKILEEPPDTSLLILVTSRPYALMETIRSRCQRISFAPLTEEELVGYIKKKLTRPDDDARLLARIARGSVGRALDIDLGVYREERDFLVGVLEATTTAPDLVRLVSAAEQMGKKLERHQFVNQADDLTVLLSDVVRLKLGEPPENIVNSDIAERLKRIADVLSFEKISRWTEQIETLIEDLGRNVNRQLAVESLFLSMA